MRESAWWKGVQKAGTEGIVNWFEGGVQKKMHMGDATKFWMEDWTGKGMFREKFYRLYNLSRGKQNCVSECGEWSQGMWQWKFSWRRPLVGREVGWLELLLQDLEGRKVLAGVRDKWTWLPSSDGAYSVNSAYIFLQEPLLTEPDPVFDVIWRSLVPSKVKAHGWRCLLDRLPTSENLLKRRVLATAEQAVCKLCHGEIESSSHLLFSCTVAMDIWKEIYKWLGISTALPQTARSHLLQFQFGGSKNKGVSAIWLATTWTIWLIRNDVVFRDVVPCLTNALDLIKWRAWHWVRAYKSDFTYSMFEWYSNPLLCVQCI